MGGIIMGQVDALKMVDHVRSRLVDLAVSANYVRDIKLSEAARKVWEGPGPDGGLVSELWVEGAFPGELSRDSLKSLGDEGVLPEELYRHICNRKVFPPERQLYNHQSEALRRSVSAGSGDKPALVITAGTGLGKTEAFLLPMLTDLWTAPERRSDGGMRCLILYPMNALVADQVDRIYRWLRGQDRLTVFHFTSETPENNRSANGRGEPKWERCRMRTRQEARGVETHDGRKIDHESLGNAPDIVITNYSMLEYMLCRPQDSRFFGPDLRCIILDEAHLYSGALATEIMMLLRRVRERCGVPPNKILQIATSATLGGDDEELLSFTADLFSTEKVKTAVIRGRYAEHKLGNTESPTEHPVSSSEIAKSADLDFSTLTSEDELLENDAECVNNLLAAATNLVSENTVYRAQQKFPDAPAPFLHESLRESPLIRKMAEILAEEKGSVISLDDLAHRLFDGSSNTDARNATIALLRLAAAARLHALDLPLVPHRLHFLFRTPEGLSVCLNPQCSGPNDRRIPLIGCLQSSADRCRYCEHILLPIHRCDNCGEWALAAHKNQETSCLEPGYFAESAGQRTYYLVTCRQNIEFSEVRVDSQTGKVRGFGAVGVSLREAPLKSEKSKAQYCPTCNSSWAPVTGDEQQPEWRRTCQSLTGGRPFALSVAAETMLHHLPPFRGNSRHWKPAEGRRLLSFSDSRASAARLGPLLTQQHEIQVVRAAIARCVKGLTPGGRSVDYFTNEIRRLEKELADSEQDSDFREHLQTELAEKRALLEQSKAGTPFAHFARRVADRSEMKQMLDRDTAETHRADNFDQSHWEINYKKVQTHVEGLIAKELQRPLKKQPSVEAVGLIEIIYPGIERLGIPPLLEEKLPSSAREEIRKTWPQILSLLLDSARVNGCIGWSEQTSGREWLGESPLPGLWLTRTRGGWSARAFVGATMLQLRRMFVSNVLREAGCREDSLKDLSEDALCAVFDQLYNLAYGGNRSFAWLEKKECHQTGHEEKDKAIRILLDRLSVRAPVHLYRCEATRTIWTSSALGWAPFEGCRGKLLTISHDELNNDARWGRSRRELLKSPIFSVGLWAEEHSAQLSPLENRRLQDLFKKGIRNVLSSTTTMELGIDIGGLNGVLLGNVPPGPANHRQRAGRAGRRSDGSAIVVTYARDSEYDREVFSRFGDFLKRELKKPTVFKDRERMIRRHLHAVLLSDFLRNLQPPRTGAMHAFGKMGAFCGIDTLPLSWNRESGRKPLWSPEGVDVAEQFLEFLSQLRSENEGFRSRLSHLSENTALSDIENLGEWHEFVNSAGEIFNEAISEWRSEVKQLREAWDEIPTNPRADVGREMAKANSIRYMIRALCEITVIEWLADRRFLPRYGFPINLQRLSVRKPIEGKTREYSEPDERYRLERSSLLALREYVPESRVLVGGRVATSRGLRKHWTDSNLDEALGLQYFSLKCLEGHIYISLSQEKTCPRCKSSPVEKKQLVFPRFGYTTAGWEKLPLGTNLERIGKQSISPIAFTECGEGEVIEDFAGVPNARITYREESPLLVRNSGRHNRGFAICTRCGFAMSEDKVGKGRMDLPSSFDAHASIFSSDPSGFCWKKEEQSSPPVLRNRVLAARELTDMALLEWPKATSGNRNGVYSLGRALMIAGARLLELDERELGMELMPLSDTNLGIVIYDTAPGGAGHCQELIKLDQEWIEAARKILYVNDEHDRRCKKACLDCILDFSGQYSANQLDRKAALTLLEDVLP